MMYTHELFKCPACGYEYEENFNHEKGKWEVVKGDKEFQKFELHGQKMGELSPWEDERRRYFFIFQCPKCRNIIGDD